MSSKNILFIILIILLILAAGYLLTQNNQPDNEVTPTDTQEQEEVLSDEEVEIRNLVVNFGSTLKNVNLLSPTATEDLEDNYGQLITPELLDSWFEDPAERAPGRAVSSPWPERIEVDSIDYVSDNEYTVLGRIIEISSTEEGDASATETPIIIMITNYTGKWLIANLEERVEE